MKIKGEPPTQKMPRSRGVLSIRYLSHNRVVFAKWPRRRPGTLPQITQQQVITWDSVQEMIRWPEPSEYAQALEETTGTAFYARDILIMAMYGHYLSWPGYGPYPGGPPPEGERGRVRVSGQVRSRAVGDPQPVNNLTRLDASNDGSVFSVIADTTNPATPELAIFCCEPDNVRKYKKRTGDEVLHGNKKFFPCDPVFYSPMVSEGTHFEWSVPSSDPQTQCDHCHYIVFQRSEDQELQWTSLPHRCPKAPGGGGAAVSYHSDLAVTNTDDTFFSSVIPEFEAGDVHIVGDAIEIPGTGLWDVSMSGGFNTGDNQAATGTITLVDASTGVPYLTAGPSSFPHGSGPVQAFIIGEPVPAAGGTFSVRCVYTLNTGFGAAEWNCGVELVVTHYDA